MIKLTQLIQGIPARYEQNVDIDSLCFDSRQVTQGDVFVAVKTPFCDYRAYINAAIERGAVAILYHDDAAVIPDYGVPVCAIPDLLDHLPMIATRFYQHPSESLQVIGVTGTNGKSSVAYYVMQALSCLGQHTAMIGTLGHGDMHHLQPLNNTTPGVLEINQLLRHDVDAGFTSVVMEVSSHGLALNRVAGIAFDVAVFTNLSRDHLDFHGSMAAYAAAKEQLLQMPGLSKAVINIDDAVGAIWAQRYHNQLNVLSYSLNANSSADIKLITQQLTRSGVHITVATPVGALELSLALMGQFNIANALATLGVLVHQGVTAPSDLVYALSQLVPAPGRMQCFGDDQSPFVVVDYAHTPDALANALMSLRQRKPGRLLVVFGCGGDRDVGKRALMAQQAEMLADVVVVTDDNPRSEDPKAIVTDILAGFTHEQSVHVIHDRRQAIAAAIDMATVNDMVLVAGKGHEDYQIIGHQRLYFDDCAVVQEELQK